VILVSGVVVAVAILLVLAIAVVNIVESVLEAVILVS